MRRILFCDADRDRHQRLHMVIPSVQGISYKTGHSFSAFEAKAKLRVEPKQHLLMLEHDLLNANPSLSVHDDRCGCSVLSELWTLAPAKRPSIVLFHGLNRSTVEALHRKGQGTRDVLFTDKPWGSFNIDIREL